MSQTEEDSPQNPFLYLISKFLPKPQQVNNESVKLITEEEGSRSNLKPDVVRLPVHNRPEVSPLKLETEEAERDTNPIVLWQVYALGGFIIMKWVWAKWQERKANSKKDGSSDEEEPSPPSDS